MNNEKLSGSPRKEITRREFLKLIGLGVGLAYLFGERKTRNAADEAGRPSDGETRGGAVPSLENQKRFIDEFLAWTNQEKIDFCLFEALPQSTRAYL